ncbi:MAG TPA: SagB/ThcOx family dehydrogenase [Candidatus Sulfotelmatobacter sp.]|nr:SagB/ThcOx family dehydrogenase [Candidatus Sulfotelmatobacter sp.]
MPRRDGEGKAGEPIVRLPPPRLQGTMSVEEAILARRSVREFVSEPLGLETVGQLLWAASGITGGDRRLRANPSAGALHPLEVLAVLPAGVYRYRPEGHWLERIREGDQRQSLVAGAYGQSFLAEAGCVLAIAAVYERTTKRYGERGRTRYVPMDAAHAAQNVLLQAVALGLGAVLVGAFDDSAIHRALALQPEGSPLYLIPVGKPRR